MMVLQRGAIKFWVGYRKKKKKDSYTVAISLSVSLLWNLSRSAVRGLRVHCRSPA